MARTNAEMWAAIEAAEWAELHPIKPKIFISISGGKTSGFMAAWAKAEYQHTHDLLFVFANTGMEDDATLDFLRQMDTRWGLNMVWLEAAVNKDGVGTGYKRVTYETATRWHQWKDNNNHPFVQVIGKYGIPNAARPHCTRELKLAPMYAYVNRLWPDKDYTVAVGIRADEEDRVSKNAQAERLIYPLVEMGITKADVNQWWDKQAFDLEIGEHRGNCLMCYKKSLGKLGLVHQETPAVFDFTRREENVMRGQAIYNHVGGGKVRVSDQTKQVFFRGWLNTDQMLEEATKYNLPSVKNQLIEMPNENSGCTESCEAFGCQVEFAF